MTEEDLTCEIENDNIDEAKRLILSGVSTKYTDEVNCL